MENHKIIAGPCQLENRDHAFMMAKSLKDIFDNFFKGMKGFEFIFKTSFDKANRTSVNSARGIGIEQSLLIFDEIRTRLNIKVLTDVHSPEQCEMIAPYVDILQIPAFLCRQTDLLIAAGKTGLTVNIKKGQFLAPWDMKFAIEKVESTGNNKIWLTERGTMFGYRDLIVDFRSVPVMQRFGYPVIFDASHSVQAPGSSYGSTGGNREMILPLAKAGLAVGANGIFVEVHDDPDNAPSDGPNMLKLDDFDKFLLNLYGYVREIF